MGTPLVIISILFKFIYLKNEQEWKKKLLIIYFVFDLARQLSSPIESKMMNAKNTSVIEMDEDFVTDGCTRSVNYDRRHHYYTRRKVLIKWKNASG